MDSAPLVPTARTLDAPMGVSLRRSQAHSSKPARPKRSLVVRTASRAMAGRQGDGGRASGARSSRSRSPPASPPTPEVLRAAEAAVQAVFLQVARGENAGAREVDEAASDIAAAQQRLPPDSPYAADCLMLLGKLNLVLGEEELAAQHLDAAVHQQVVARQAAFESST